MADLALTVDLSKRALSTSLSDSAPLVLGDQLRVTLAFTRNSGGSDVPADLPIRSLLCSLGKTLAPPDSGVFSLASHTLAGAPIALAEVDVLFDEPSMLAKLAPLLWVTAVEKAAPGTWVLTSSKTDNLTAPPDFTVTANKLSPVSFVRTRAFKDDGFWCVEIRCIQTPYAFAGSFDRVLPPPPSIQRVRAGHVDGDIQINEIQRLTIPNNFAGLYTITFDFRETIVLGLQDGPDQVAAALNALWPDGKVRFKGTLPEDNRIYLEAIGPLAATAINLMTTTVRSFQRGAVNFILDLTDATLETALRDTPQLTDVPFECEAYVVEDGLDPADLANPARPIRLWQDKAVINRGQIWKELALVPALNWIRPPVARDYVPLTTDQILIGTQASYVSPRGNGVLRSFACDHGLATAAIISVVVKDNATGAALVQGVAFDWTVTNIHTVTVDVHAGWATPGANAWAILITSAGPATAFQAHTHTLAQIVGLLDALNTLGARISAIETLLPTAPPAIAAAASALAFTMQIADRGEVLPGRWRADFLPEEALKSGKGLSHRPGVLLPAIHVVSANASAILPLPAASAQANKVFLNNTGAPLALPGGRGVNPSVIPAGAYFGSNGSAWYPVTKAGATKSYFPAAFERTLFQLNVNDRMLRAGQNLTVEFDLTAAMLRADSDAQWVLVIEHGAITQDTAPATTAENIAAITWNAAPLLKTVLDLAPVPFTARYGVRIARNAAGTAITASALLYGQYEASGAAPATAVFALRARLVEFDTENSAPGTGWACFQFANAKAQSS